MSARLHLKIADIGRAAWDGLRTDDSPFMSYDYLEALEATGCVGNETGWIPYHLTLSDPDGAITAAAPLYLKTHSMGEYVFDQGWARAYEQAGGRYYPRLVSASPFTPVTGQRLLAHSESGRAALAQAMTAVCDTNMLSSVHVLFPTREDWQTLGDQGWLLRQDRQYWWDNQGYDSFDGFLGQLSANRRKVIRRERRDVQALVDIRTLTGADITEANLDQMYAFITNTYERKWGQPYMTRAFFSVIVERMRERVVLFFAYDGDEAVAGAINFIGNDTLYGRQWGCLRDIPFLHFELCYYQAIDFAIAHGLKRVEAGTQGDHKLSRGYLPHPVYSAHHIREERLRAPVARFLEDERAAVAEEIEWIEAEASPFRKDGKSNL